IQSRTEAEKLRGVKLFMPRARLPKPEKGRFYVEDLKDLKAVDDKGKEVARITNVFNFGAGDIVALENRDGREWMLPFKKPYIGTPDMDEGVIKVVIPPDWPFSENRNQKKKRKRDVIPAKAGIQHKPR